MKTKIFFGALAIWLISCFFYGRHKGDSNKELHQSKYNEVKEFILDRKLDAFIDFSTTAAEENVEFMAGLQIATVGGFWLYDVGYKSTYKEPTLNINPDIMIVGARVIDLKKEGVIVNTSNLPSELK